MTTEFRAGCRSATRHLATAAALACVSLLPNNALAVSVSSTDPVLVEVDGFGTTEPLTFILNAFETPLGYEHAVGSFAWSIDPAPAPGTVAGFSVIGGPGNTVWSLGSALSFEPGPLPEFSFTAEDCCVAEYSVALDVTPDGSTVQMFAPDQYLLTSTATAQLVGLLPLAPPSPPEEIPLPATAVLMASALVTLAMRRRRQCGKR